MFKPITKARNKKRINVYFVLALIFASLGLIIRNPSFYVISVVLLSLALFRKHEKIKDFLCPENPMDFLGYWLMKRLKE